MILVGKKFEIKNKPIIKFLKVKLLKKKVVSEFQISKFMHSHFFELT